MSRVDLSDFLSAYLSEVDEHLATSNSQVLKLEASMRSGEPTVRPIRELFRALHTIKGLSSMVGVEPVVGIDHRLETALKRADRAGGRLPDGAIDVLLQGLRVVPVAAERGDAAPAGLLFALLVLTGESAETVGRSTGVEDLAIDVIAEPAGVPPATLPDGEGLPADSEGEGDLVEDSLRRGVLRVDVTKLDHALDRLSQLVVNRAKLAREVAILAERGVDVRALSAAIREQGRHLHDLRSSVLAVRMVAVAELLERVPLVVRGLRRATGKAVRLEIDAGRAELDKSVAERLFPAIVHLVRNAVDHAIEAPDDRRRAGKDDSGLLRITCFTRGNAQLELVIEDDGRGIDTAELARRAGQEEPVTDAALLALLCRPGLSTREQVTTTSGRGMGMDIVRRIVVGDRGGELRVSTGAGGTRFSMRVPLTLSIIDGLIFECREQPLPARRRGRFPRPSRWWCTSRSGTRSRSPNASTKSRRCRSSRPTTRSSCVRDVSSWRVPACTWSSSVQGGVSVDGFGWTRSISCIGRPSTCCSRARQPSTALARWVSS